MGIIGKYSFRIFVIDGEAIPRVNNCSARILLAYFFARIRPAAGAILSHARIIN